MNEEDINNLSEIIELCEEEINNNNENVTAILDLTDLKSLRNLINRNKELEEENKRLNKLDLSNNKLIANMSERHFYDSEKIRNSIPTSKVEEKIYKTKFYIPEYQGEFIAIEDLQELL